MPKNTTIIFFIKKINKNFHLYQQWDLNPYHPSMKRGFYHLNYIDTFANNRIRTYTLPCTYGRFYHLNYIDIIKEFSYLSFWRLLTSDTHLTIISCDTIYIPKDGGLTFKQSFGPRHFSSRAIWCAIGELNSGHRDYGGWNEIWTHNLYFKNLGCYL